MNKYLAYYKGYKLEVLANSLYAAKLAAIEHFKPSKKSAGLLSVHLVELADGKEVVHSTASI